MVTTPNTALLTAWRHENAPWENLTPPEDLAAHARTRIDECRAVLSSLEPDAIGDFAQRLPGRSLEDLQCYFTELITMWERALNKDAHAQPDGHVGLHSRGRVEELESAVEREIDELCQQAKLPGQRSIIAQMEVARDALHEAGRGLARAERELAKEEGR